ncbi:MAG: hypothetical protein KatS3mg111_2705 [Pirellulaceae bacterium]|nr:MAG: hypothetical protein KatS3mg111_2705 [Pirellulaceae bacterium]
MFVQAVKDRLLEESPHAACQSGEGIKPDRMAYIDAQTAQRVLEACPDADWRAIFVRCRWAGLRRPSKALRLKWADIDFTTGVPAPGRTCKSNSPVTSSISSWGIPRAWPKSITCK